MPPVPEKPLLWPEAVGFFSFHGVPVVELPGYTYVKFLGLDEFGEEDWGNVRKGIIDDDGIAISRGEFESLMKRAMASL